MVRFVVSPNRLKKSSQRRWVRFVERLKGTESEACMEVGDCFGGHENEHPECEECDYERSCKEATAEEDVHTH